MFQDPRRRNEGMNLGGDDEANIINQAAYFKSRLFQDCLFKNHLIIG